MAPTFNGGDHKVVIKWQTEWQACDELQMAWERAKLNMLRYEITVMDSDLFRRGWDLRGRIEFLTKVPTYYYQYRVGRQ